MTGVQRHSITNNDNPSTEKRCSTPSWPRRLVFGGTLVIIAWRTLTATDFHKNKGVYWAATNAISFAPCNGNFTVTGTSSSRIYVDNQQQQKQQQGRSFFHYPSKIFGHIHMAKTAGTELNGILASTFERICGHKGYSYDYYQYNERVRRTGKIDVDNYSGGKDTLSGPSEGKGKYWTSYNRGRVNPNTMREIGYENCDWISHEMKANYWQTFARDKKLWPMEFHVPCRDPLEHLMSMCNHLNIQFDCHTTDFAKEIRRCDLELFRYDPVLHSYGDVKCFDPLPVENYVTYMSQGLQPRRIQVPHVHRTSNERRNKTGECIWKPENAAVATTVKQILLKKYPYYDFCDRCMGSENDLLTNTNAVIN